MSVLLFIVSAIAIAVGALMIGFGIPINEFSFGNTLIGAGVTTFIGGLVIFGLGAVVAQLHRVVEALAVQPPRVSRSVEPFEQPARGPASRVPFPLKQKTPAEVVRGSTADDAPTAAPTLRNPDELPAGVEEADELPLPPWQAPTPPVNGSGGTETRPEAAPDAGWRAPPPLPPLRSQAGYFETMWPAPGSRPPKAAPAAEHKFEAKTEAKAEPKSDVKPGPPPEGAPAKHAEPEAVKSPPGGEPRAVAILKSGVVDGMGYTLYIDGSIEAELPQGTLRFASINELRSHLEKNA